MIPRVRVSRLCLLVLVCTLMMLHWQRKCHPTDRSQRMELKTQLLILSTWRSGSSFVGQLFNQNPEVFYMMEPFWHIWKKLANESPHLLQISARNLLRSLFLCDMAELKSYLPQNHFLSDIFMWPESRALCSPPACNAFQRTDIIDRQICFKDCHQVLFTKLEEACRTYSHIVVKAVRFLDLEVLYPLLRDPTLNMKIIHLVRDPRAIFSSRQYVGLNDSNVIISKSKNSEPNISLVMQEICKAQVKIYSAAKESSPPFPTDRYRLVRFEDLVKDPLAYLKQWYKAMGLIMSSKLESWVYNISHQTAPKIKGLMPISGDSKRIAEHWRDKLSFQKVKEVQDFCQQDMEVFGYRPVWSIKEQKDMSLELVLPQKNFLEGH
ncbi:carbohydrate sulfotransferase 6-like [Microcaecilia unicolor]|uniref:Sulfotransferase n=1 Tax=Microcaecilia unicolor TaxID=1415580 RepID=A0A6P7X6I9_9AMPH|nr:carbohydrate sulfotransferase 6-like [Microcaecilia unicolor]